VVGHGHYGDPAKRGPSEMTCAVCSRVLRKIITHGSQFATGRPRPSAPEPGGSDRSSGPDPLLTRHPPAERPGETFGPSGRPVGESGRPACEDSETRRDRPPWPTPRNPCVQSERRALMEDASLVRLARAAVRNHS
jgi:hypothetical protein